MSKLARYWQIVVPMLVFASGILLFSVAMVDAETDREDVVSFDNVPNSVQASIKTELNGSDIKTITKESDDGFTTYEVEYAIQEVAHSIKMSEKGVVLEREVQKASASLPPDVLAQVQKQFPKATIKESDEVVSTYYEVVVDTGNKEREIKVFANGQPMDEEDE